MEGIKFIDILYFLAELAVYVAVAWWAFTRGVPTVARWGLAIGGIVLFATSWGLFAAPKATFPLAGAADTVFRVAWFGLGAAAAVLVIVSSGAGNS